MRSLIVFVALLPSIALAQTKPKDPVPPAKKVVTEPEYPLDLEKIGLTLPYTTDTELQRLLTSKKTIFYKLPSVWQHYIPASRIEHSNLTLGTKSYSYREATWGIYFSPFLSDFNANRLFPWETTAGLNDSQKQTSNIYRTVNFINLPEDESKNTIPILLLNELPIKWIYPDGTTVGEIIYVVHEDKRYVQEIRTRQKTKGATDWEPHLYRPIGDRKEFMRLAGIADYTPAKRYMFLRNPQEDEVFKMEGLVERLPPLSSDKVKRLLSQSFKEVTAAPWSPSADQDFHILPRNYCFSLLESIDVVTCANCHRQTQISVLNLVPREPLIINNPDKVGNIRGCDAVFTNSSVRENDEQPAPERISLRKYDLDNKTVKIWKGGTYDLPGDYKLTEFVQYSLRDYELPPQQFLHTKKEPNSGVEPAR
jgi:hypothetical protein